MSKSLEKALGRAVPIEPTDEFALRISVRVVSFRGILRNNNCLSKETELNGFMNTFSSNISNFKCLIKRDKFLSCNDSVVNSYATGVKNPFISVYQ